MLCFCEEAVYNDMSIIMRFAKKAGECPWNFFHS